MEDLYAIAPNPSGSDDFVELSAPSTKYRVFKKHILDMGTLYYNGKAIDIDVDFYNTMVKNFNDGVCDTVSVPKVDGANRHVEDPDNNIGKVVALSRSGKKIYAHFEARDAEAADKVGKTYLGASAFFSTNALDRRTQKRVGPTLYHVAITNRPYVNRLDEFEEVLLSMADGSNEAVVLTATPKENTHMELEDILEVLKVEHDIDVRGLQEKAGQVDAAVALSAQILDDLVEADLVALSDDDSTETYDTIRSAITSASETIVSLSAQIAEMNEEQVRLSAEAKVDALIEKALIHEDKRDVYVKLAMTDAETFDALVPEEAMVRLSEEDGTDEDATPDAEVDAEAETKAALDRILAYEGFEFTK